MDEVSERINQLYRAYLLTSFEEEYYRERHSTSLETSNHFDLIVGLGAALSGGSGLGILANPAFAWVCGTLTSASVLAAVVKQSYRLDEKARASLERVALYGGARIEYLSLVQDVQAKKQWNEEFETRFSEMRSRFAKYSPFPYSHWDEERLRAIQNKIKNREDYEKWWKFTRSI